MAAVMTPDPNHSNKLQQARKALEDSFKTIESKNLHKEEDVQCKSDITTMVLKVISNEIAELQSRADNFKGECFTRDYRTMQGEFTKLEGELDLLKVEGRDEIREKRRPLLAAIQKVADTLAGKTHQDGKSCPNCEIRE